MEKYVITIARGFGSGGKIIGNMLAEQLGINYYDRELIRLASEDSGIHEKLFYLTDEKVKGGLSKLAKKIYDGKLIPPESSAFVSDENLFNYQAKTIREVAQRESCVIVGRCADYILKDMPDVIKLFIWAPEEYCVDVLKETYGYDRAKALKEMAARDKHRAEYYRHHTGRDWCNAKNYDICFNTAEIGFQKCVDLVKAYIAQL